MGTNSTDENVQAVISHKLLIWANMPTHHQVDFYRALREKGIDLIVHYYDRPDEERVHQGWQTYEQLPEGERYVGSVADALTSCPDWMDRTHLVPGYRIRFLRDLVRKLSGSGVPWMHWSEPSHGGFRWLATYPLKRWYAAKVNRFARAACAIGMLAEQDFVSWGIYPTKIRFLPYAVSGVPAVSDVDAESADFSNKFKLSFLYLGSLSHRKGTDLLIEAFARTAKRHPDACLILVGHDSQDTDYLAQVARLGISQSVLFRGPIQSNCIASVLSNSDVVVLPSRFDGWGMTLNEAASAGKALIATDACGSAHHIIEEGVNGFRVAAGDVQALENGMGKYCLDLELCRIHGEKSKTRFKEFTPECNAERVIKILDGLPWN